MARGAWMMEQRKRVTTCLAETAAGAVAVRIGPKDNGPVHGDVRRVVAYCDGEVGKAEFAAELRNLAALIEEKDG